MYRGRGPRWICWSLAPATLPLKIRPDVNQDIIRLLCWPGTRRKPHSGLLETTLGPLGLVASNGCGSHARLGCYSLVRYALYAGRRPKSHAALFLMEKGAAPVEAAPSDALDWRPTLSPLMEAVIWEWDTKLEWCNRYWKQQVL